MPEACRIAVLVSGQGRNLQALIEACADSRIAGQIVGVISNRPEAAGLERARAAGIPAQALSHLGYPSREGFDSALSDALDTLRPDVIVLAGFMRVLGDAFVRHHAGRLINIHPSLLPKHPGLHTHRRALDAGDTEHGATVHFVTKQLDGGPGIIQGRVSVLPEDTEHSLSERVMHSVELRIFPQAIAWMASGALRLEDKSSGRAVLRGRVLDLPLQLEDLEEPFQ